MSLVKSRRDTVIKNEAVVLVDIVIWRDNRQIYSHLYLSHQADDRYLVVGGGSEGLRIFGEDNIIYLKPIDHQDYSHMVTQ